MDARRTLDAIIFRLRSGCQWNQLPEGFPDDSSVHRTFQRWVRLGVFECIWSTLVDQLPSWVGWTGSGKRRMPCWARPGWGRPHWPKPTDRGQREVKRACWSRRLAAHWRS